MGHDAGAAHPRDNAHPRENDGAGKAYTHNKVDAGVTHPCDKVPNTHGVHSMHIHGLGPRSGPASEASKNMPPGKCGPAPLGTTAARKPGSSRPHKNKKKERSRNSSLMY